MKSVGIVANPAKQDALKVAKKVLPLFQSKSWNILLEPWLAENLGKSSLGKERPVVLGRSDMILVLGGDGTLLAAARDLDGKATPLLGVNLGGVGFLTEVQCEELPAFLAEVFEGQPRVEKRETLEATLIRAGTRVDTFRALNEVVITKGALSRLLKLEVTVGKEHLTHFVADGLIVATPTGSTGHSLSAGGPIVHPGLNAFVLSPICPHSLTSRPLLIPMDQELSVLVESGHENMVLTVDGQQGIPVLYKDTIKIKRSEKPVFLLLSERSSYFDVLRKKLQWGQRH